MRIAIGTAQFGGEYGIANAQGKISYSNAKEIVNFAKSVGINTFDTAISYGSSEKILGKIGVSDQKIITKLPNIPENLKNIDEWVNTQIKNSLDALKIKNLYGLLLHRPMQLLDLDKKKIWETLNELKRQRIVEKIGFSIYEPDELDQLCSLFKPDIVQTPYNVFDRRFETSGWLKSLYDDGIEIHIRSIFLQGLLLMPNNSRPSKFRSWQSVWNQWDHWMDVNKITPLQATLSFALSDKRISKIVIGIDCINQFREIVSNYNVKSKLPELFTIKDKRLLNPSEWNSL